MFKLTTVRRALALAVAALLGGLAATAFSVPNSSVAATATTYSYTVAGVDMHSLDAHIVPQFVPNTGGGVQAISDGTTPETAWYLEASLELPVGAKVTSVAVTYSNACNQYPQFVFGYYLPALHATKQNLVIDGGSDCAKTLVRTGSPITTIGTARRYALDWVVGLVYPWGTTHTGPTFNGATIKYTCTAPCVP
jgi:hypothetical protein